MSIFLYRWLPSTIHSNIYYGFKNIIIGIKNIIRWSPIIFNDRDWDWSHLATVMEYKLRRMSKLFKENGMHAHAEGDARDMLVCAEILKRLIEDDWKGIEDFLLFEKNQAELQRLMGKIIGGKMRSWWD